MAFYHKKRRHGRKGKARFRAGHATIVPATVPAMSKKLPHILIFSLAFVFFVLFFFKTASDCPLPRRSCHSAAVSPLPLPQGCRLRPQVCCKNRPPGKRAGSAPSRTAAVKISDIFPTADKQTISVCRKGRCLWQIRSLSGSAANGSFCR